MDFTKAILAFRHRDESLTYELPYMTILSHDLEAYDCYGTCYKEILQPYIVWSLGNRMGNLFEDTLTLTGKEGYMSFKSGLF